MVHDETGITIQHPTCLIAILMATVLVKNSQRMQCNKSKYEIAMVWGL